MLFLQCIALGVFGYLAVGKMLIYNSFWMKEVIKLFFTIIRRLQ